MGFLVSSYGSTEDPFVYSVVNFRFIREQEAIRELKILVSGQEDCADTIFLLCHMCCLH